MRQRMRIIEMRAEHEQVRRMAMEGEARQLRERVRIELEFNFLSIHKMYKICAAPLNPFLFARSCVLRPSCAFSEITISEFF